MTDKTTRELYVAFSVIHCPDYNSETSPQTRTVALWLGHAHANAFPEHRHNIGIAYVTDNIDSELPLFPRNEEAPR